MCDFSGKLIAWMDHELPEGEAAEVERHLQICARCKEEFNAYAEVSAAFDAHCDEVIAPKTRLRRSPRWAKVLPGAAATAATIAAIFLLFPHGHTERPPAPPSIVLVAAIPAPSIAPGAPPLASIPRVHTHRPRAAARMQTQDAGWLPAGPAILIAFPAEEMFPPGAIPRGIDFVADVSIAADGSAQQLRLRP